jgi:hypothetical protein
MTTTRPAQHTVLAQVSALKGLDLAALRDEWRTLIGTEPPGYGREFLRRRLIYRVQEIAYGGLPEAVRTALSAIDEKAKPKPTAKDGIPIAGSVIIREWGGVRHEVTVLADGFEYRGQKWRSLSHIARTITGTRWNGPMFFGLRVAKPGEQVA